jgi:hypothetical protein
MPRHLIRPLPVTTPRMIPLACEYECTRHMPHDATERMDLKTSEVSSPVADARYFPDTRGEHVATERAQTTATKATSATTGEHVATERTQTTATTGEHVATERTQTSTELPNAATARQHRVTVSAEAPAMLTYDDDVWSTDSEALSDATANEELYCSIAMLLWNANFHFQHVEDIIKETMLEEASAGMNAIASLETNSNFLSHTKSGSIMEPEKSAGDLRQACAARGLRSTKPRSNKSRRRNSATWRWQGCITTSEIETLPSQCGG